MSYYSSEAIEKLLSYEGNDQSEHFDLIVEALEQRHHEALSFMDEVEAWKQVVKEASDKLTKFGFPAFIDDGSAGGQPLTLDEQINQVAWALVEKDTKQSQELRAELEAFRGHELELNDQIANLAAQRVSLTTRLNRAEQKESELRWALEQVKKKVDTSNVHWSLPDYSGRCADALEIAERALLR
jgi:hypothetical protein